MDLELGFPHLSVDMTICRYLYIHVHVPYIAMIEENLLIVVEHEACTIIVFEIILISGTFTGGVHFILVWSNHCSFNILSVNWEAKSRFVRREVQFV